MKKVILFIILLIFCQSTQAENTEKITINMDIIAMIESSGNSSAYNKVSRARGLYQITPICLADYNQFHQINQYTQNDLFNPEINEKVAKWYFLERIPELLKHYEIMDNVENRLIAYNAGISRLKRSYMLSEKLPNETQKYIKKYFTALEKSN